jgi:hypothetical protein
VEALRADLAAAEASLSKARVNGRRTAKLAERMRFTRAGFTMIDSYVGTALAAARDADYVAAVEAGNKALKAHSELRAMNPLFVSGLVGGEDGTAWLAGEVRQYAELRASMDGRKGTLVQRLPREWAFKVEKPLPASWRYSGPEGPRPTGGGLLVGEPPSAANGWRTVRTDLYLQGQGILALDGQSHLGHYWYKARFTLEPGEAAPKLRLMFPGLFNEAWLYINGERVGHRSFNEPWWLTDYRFEWDVDISRHVRPGSNEIALRGFNPHHFGGMFRRPFLYRPR